MKLGVFLLLLVGFASSMPDPSIEELEKLVRKEFRNEGPEYFEEALDDLWKHYTREELEPPVFYSETYGKTVTGKNMVSYYGRPIYAFQGIQYGAPPIGQRRFKPSQPSTLYDNEEDNIMANHLGFKCPQSAMIGHQPAGNEDCLYLNVYTPYLPGSNDSKPLPVMLFIYGGSFTTGDSSMYLPTKLLEHDVILVTIHYRLGAFGFFNLESFNAPGNSALYDMVLSLKWVNKYITDFGGDPNKVTVFGESAGSVSANYMLLIKQVKDLVHGVICESGSTLDVWALDLDPRYAAEYVAEYVGCLSDDDSEMYSCVSSVPADDLVMAQGALVGEDRRNGLMGFRGAAPSIQKYNGDAWEILVEKHPRDYFESGEVNPVPLLIGTNKQEGSFVLGVSYWSFLVPNGLVDNELYMKNQMTADLLGSFGVNDTSHALSTSFDDYFCPGVDLGTFESAAPCFTDFIGAMFLKGSCWECANLHSYYTDQATYHYAFEFESDDSMYYWLLGKPPTGLEPGVTHSDELMYLFSMPAIMEGLQIATFQRMTLLWTNFATYGDPTPDENQEPWQNLKIPKWPTFNTNDHHYMLMRDNFTAEIEYVDRWKITYDEFMASDTTTSTTTTSTTTTSTTPTTTTSDPDATTDTTGTTGDGSTVTGSTDTTVTGSTGTTGGAGGSTTLDPCEGPTQEEYDELQASYEALENDYDELESKSNAYLICMIIFIVLFVIADGVCLYLYMKNR